MIPTQKLILLVDDNPDDRDLTLRALAKNNLGLQVRTACDGVEAVALLLEAEEADRAFPLPALILLDLKLPKVDGLEVLRRLRADPRTRLIPVVVLTSSSEKQDRLESYRQGANSYIRKSVDYDEFVEAVGRIGHYWLCLNEPPPAGD
jgi:two-component system response regulator